MQHMQRNHWELIEKWVAYLAKTTPWPMLFGAESTPVKERMRHWDRFVSIVSPYL